MALTPEQKRIASQIIKVGKKKGASHKELLSSIETAITESNIANLPPGAQTSSGWRQERDLYYPSWNKSVKDDARRYFSEAAKVNSSNMTAGQLAQTVQRSAYPDRYDTHKQEAKQILKSLKGKTQVNSGGSSMKIPKSKVMTQPAVDLESERQSATLSFIQQEDKDYTDYAAYKSTIDSLQDQKAQYKTIGGGKVKIPGKTTKAGKNKQVKAKAPRSVVQIGRMAQQMGLNVGENPRFGGVAPVHTSGSYHYSGRAIDVSGDPTKMAKFAKKVDRKYGEHLAELFWNGAGARNRDNGQRVPKGYVSGHTDHVHVAV